MSDQDLLLLLTTGFIVILVVSLFIARQIGKHLSAGAAVWTHFGIAVVAGYYLVDSGTISDRFYFLLWGGVIVSQLLLFGIKWRNIRRTDDRETAENRQNH